MDEFTLSNYLNNPEANAKALANYKKRYSTIRGKITSRWYINNSTKTIIAVIKIPSEKTKNVYYDVIFEFKGSNPGDTSRKLKMLPIRVFSNCPSFVYADANYFKQKGWLIDWAMSLYDPKAFPEEEKKDDTIKDAKPASFKYEKSLYYACLYISGLNAITVLKSINSAMTVVSTKQILMHIKDTNTAMTRRQTKVKTEKTIDKAAKDIQKASKGILKVPSVGKIKSVKKTGKIKHI